jgi:putative transposase
MEKFEHLEYGKIYHIYNRGINKGDVFFETKNYEYFMNLYAKHIDPIADTYAWCLMKNHFHLLVKIKDESQIKETRNPYQYFSNLFNAYAKGINKTYGRTSSLFQKKFKRKLIDNEVYFKNLVIYIHNNPVNHNICENAVDYAWSSYLTCISNKLTKLKRDEVINYFDNLNNFKSVHKHSLNFSDLEDYIAL